MRSRIVLALEGQARRHATHLHGEILLHMAETVDLEPMLLEAFAAVLTHLDRWRLPAGKLP